MRQGRRLVSGRTLPVALAGVVGVLSALAWSGRPSYWFDEAATVSAAGRPVTQLWPMLLRTDAVHGLYYVVMHGWMALFGGSEVATRSLSALGLGATCAGVAALGRMVGRPGLGLAAGLTAVLLPGLAWSGVEARQYAWSAAVAVLATVLLVRADRSGRSGDWAWYALAIAVGAYLFLFSLLLPAAHLVTLLVLRRPLRRWAAASCAAVALSLPVLYVGSTQRTRQLSWLSLEPLPMLRRVALRMYFVGPDAPAEGAAQIGALLLLCLTVALVVVGLARVRHDPAVRSTVALALPWAVLPPAVLVCASLLGSQLYQERYLTFCAPGLALLVGLGLVELRQRLPLLVAVSALGLLATTPMLVQQRAEDVKHRENYRGLADYLGPRGQGVQRVVTSAPGGRGILIAYPDRTGPVTEVNLLADPGASNSLWGRIGGPDQAGAAPSGGVGLISRVGNPGQADPWLRWLRRNGCRRSGTLAARRYLVRTYDCAAGAPGSRPRRSAVRGLPRAVGGDGVAVAAGGAAVAARPVPGQVQHDPVAVVVGAHPQARQLVDADHVDHRHRGLHGDPGGQRGVPRDRVQVPVERLVPHQLRHRAGVGEHPVHQLGRPVTVGEEQLTEHRAQGPHVVELGRSAPAAAGVGELLVELVELLHGGQRVRLDGAVHQHDRRLQRHLGVMGENHVDMLPHFPVTS